MVSPGELYDTYLGYVNTGTAPGYAMRLALATHEGRDDDGAGIPAELVEEALLMLQEADGSPSPRGMKWACERYDTAKTGKKLPEVVGLPIYGAKVIRPGSR